jgi:hypothetical protein
MRRVRTIGHSLSVHTCTSHGRPPPTTPPPCESRIHVCFLSPRHWYCWWPLRLWPWPPPRTSWHDSEQHDQRLPPANGPAGGLFMERLRRHRPSLPTLRDYEVSIFTVCVVCSEAASHRRGWGRGWGAWMAVWEGVLRFSFEMCGPAQCSTRCGQWGGRHTRTECGTPSPVARWARIPQ